jgi:arginyl-tRNA synthetase
MTPAKGQGLGRIYNGVVGRSLPEPFDARLVKSILEAALAQAIARAFPDVGPLPFTVAVERPKNPAHGDYACNAALQLAKPLKKNPREVGEAIRQALTHPDIAATDLAGPGFINIHLTAAARTRVVGEVVAAGAAYGRGTAGVSNGSPQRVMVEFVSANPTGPLHVGHGRQAALGDSLCRLLENQGWSVHREFYYNDAGVQIGTLAASTQARIRGLRPGDADWPTDAYNGDYIADVAKDYLAKATVTAGDRTETASGDPEDLDAIRQFAVAYLRREQDLDLKAFAVAFDHYYLESSLYTSGKVTDAVERMVASGLTYEQEGALWLKTTAFDDLSGMGGPVKDDKDRVMRKSDGSYTYFVPDVAYHLDKYARGFTRVINIQGTDHYSTISRVRAGLRAADRAIPAGYPDYLLHTMVTVMKGGEIVKVTKRAGGYVTLRDLIDWTNKDAVRFMLISRKADTEFTFDVDLAVARTNDNPVYYVQYAHARICSVLGEWGGDVKALASADLSSLKSDPEVAVLRALTDFPLMLDLAAREFAPHAVTTFLTEFAGKFHTWYNAERFLVEDESVKLARLALALAARQVIANGLAVIGVSAPEKM